MAWYHKQAPAQQLATIYHRRWEIESSYAEIKNRLRGTGFVLRSNLPDLACQEVYALLTVYQTLCSLEVQVAEQGRIDPERVPGPLLCATAAIRTAARKRRTPMQAEPDLPRCGCWRQLNSSTCCHAGTASSGLLRLNVRSIGVTP